MFYDTLVSIIEIFNIAHFFPFRRSSLSDAVTEALSPLHFTWHYLGRIDIDECSHNVKQLNESGGEARIHDWMTDYLECKHKEYGSGTAGINAFIW